MRVFVLGSKRHLDNTAKADFDRACRQLGAALAAAGHTPIVCSPSKNTADPHVADGMREIPGEHQITVFRASDSPPQDYTNAYSGKQTLSGPVKITTRTTEGGWRLVHLNAIRDCDAVLAIGGSTKGTHTSIYSSELMNTPIVLVPSFGGAAQGAWSYFRGRYYRDDEADSLSQNLEEQGDAWGKNIVAALAKIVKRAPLAARRTAYLYTSAASAAVAISFWFLLFFSAVPIGNNYVALVVIIGLASISGSVLRLLLEEMGAIKPSWGSIGAWPSIVLGFILGFGLFLFAEFASLALTGESLEIESHKDLQRLAVVLSPLLFLSSLFVERAWSRLAEKGKVYLERL